jgi:hypothetical protein
VGALAAVLMVGFLLAAIVQGLLAGDPGAMLRSALVEVPISVAATAVLVSVTQLLLGVTDESSNLVLDRVPEDLGRFFSGFGTAANFATSGLAGGVILVLFLAGALMVWIELLVRSSLLYWLVAAAPLLAAARVWPAARGAFAKLCEIGLALILSKFAIALALGLGAAALAGGGPNPGDVGTQVGTDLAGLLTGAVLMGLAAFTPFVLLRLLPLVEGAVAAQGISRSPVRAAQAGMQGAYYIKGLDRMAGVGAGGAGAGGGVGGAAVGGGGAKGGAGGADPAGGAGGAGGAGPEGGAGPAGGRARAGSAGGAGGPGRPGGAGGAGPAGGAGGAGRAGGVGGAGPAGGVGGAGPSSGAGGAAATGPAAAAAVPVGAGAAAARAARHTAEQARDAGRESS